jgi:hypothetical protein
MPSGWLTFISHALPGFAHVTHAEDRTVRAKTRLFRIEAGAEKQDTRKLFSLPVPDSMNESGQATTASYPM